MRTTQGLSIMIKDSWSHSPVSSHAVREFQLLRYVKCILFVIWFIFVCYRNRSSVIPVSMYNFLFSDFIAKYISWSPVCCSFLHRSLSLSLTLSLSLSLALSVSLSLALSVSLSLSLPLALSVSLSLSLFLFIQTLSLVFSSPSQIFPPLVSPLPLSLQSNYSLFPSMRSALSLSHAR